MKKSKVAKFKSLTFYILVFLVGILLFLLSFVFSIKFFSGELDMSSTKKVLDDSKQQDITDSKNGEKKSIFLIKEMNNMEIKALDVKNGIDSEIKINSACKNKFKSGDIVNIFFKNGVVKDIEINSNAWQKNRINGFKFDLETKEFWYENKRYFLSDNLFIKNNRDLSKISLMSLISIKGLGKKILYLEVNKGAGKINFLGGEKILNGIVKIDSKDIFELGSVKSKELSEGPHNLLISGDNIENYSKDFFIKDNEQIGLDLSQVEFKNGLLKINLDQAGCLVYIDNKKIVLSDPIFLSYGEHELKIIKNGFEDYINKILIDSQTHEINISMTKKIDLGKVFIQTEPSDAEIYLDNAYIGKGVCEINIEYGKHTIYATKDKYLAINLPIEINKKSSSYNIKLELDTNSLIRD